MSDCNQEVIADTLTFIPKRIPFPTYDVNLKLKHAIYKIINLLSNMAPRNYPHSHIIENTVQTAFKNLYLAPNKTHFDQANI